MRSMGSFSIQTRSGAKKGKANMAKHVAILGAILILAIGAAPAPAAKGVKKSGERQFKGTVVSVHRSNKGAAGTLTIRVTHKKRKKGQNAGNQGNRNQGTAQKTFNIDQRTRVQGGTNGQQNQLGALRNGERVTVFEHGRHADRVVIHQTSNGKRASRVTYHRGHRAQTASRQPPHRTTTAQAQRTTGTPHAQTTRRPPSPAQGHHTATAPAHHATPVQRTTATRAPTSHPKSPPHHAAHAAAHHSAGHRR